MPFDQFSSVNSGDVSSKDSESPALAFLQDIGRFHRENPAAALATDAALAAGAIISLTPEGRKVGSMIIDEAANAGRGLMKAGDDLAAQMLDTNQFEPAYAMASVRVSAGAAGRFQSVDSLADRGLTMSMSSAQADGSIGARKTLDDFNNRGAETFVDKMMDLQERLSDVYNAIRDGKPVAEIQTISRDAARKSLRFEDASNRFIFGSHDKDGVVKAREAVYEVNNHLMDPAKEPKDILPRINSLIDEVYKAAFKK